MAFGDSWNDVEMLEWAEQHEKGKAMEALPITDKERLKLPRSYIINVIFTLVGKPFQEWAEKRINDRNARVTDERSMAIDMDPEIEAIWR